MGQEKLKLTIEQKELLDSLTPLEEQLLNVIRLMTMSDVDEDTFDFGKVVDDLASHYKKACRDRFDEWGEKLHNTKTLCMAVNTDERLSEKHMKWRKEEYGESYLKTVIAAAIQLGIDQSERIRGRENRMWISVFNKPLQALITKKEIEHAEYAAKRNRQQWGENNPTISPSPKE